MDELKIEKGIMPRRALTLRGRAQKYSAPNWEILEDGDSAYVNSPASVGPNHYSALREAARRRGFFVRSEPEGSGRRVWFFKKKAEPDEVKP